MSQGYSQDSLRFFAELIGLPDWQNMSRQELYTALNEYSRYNYLDLPTFNRAKVVDVYFRVSFNTGVFSHPTAGWVSDIVYLLDDEPEIIKLKLPKGASLGGGEYDMKDYIHKLTVSWAPKPEVIYRVLTIVTNDDFARLKHEIENRKRLIGAVTNLLVPLLGIVTNYLYPSGLLFEFNPNFRCGYRPEAWEYEFYYAERFREIHFLKPRPRLDI